MGNVIKSNGSTIIINGGDPLEGCPKDFKEADAWAEKANEDNEDGPKWSFDCGFKLDYDGPVISVSSRFYPPTTHGGSTWDGTVSVFFFDKEIREKKFDCKTLDELKSEVEKYVYGLKNEIFFKVSQ